jgi:GDP-L-fucose synthase
MKAVFLILLFSQFVLSFDKESRIYVAGHTGLVGSALMRRLKSEGYVNLITATSKELDLRDQSKVEKFFKKYKPEYVFLAAAKVGGIKANLDNPAQFFYDNIMISTNIIHTSYLFGVKKLLFLGSSCIYPKFAEQPIKEEYLLSGKLEPTNESYALAKICGLKLCQAYRKQYGVNFISCMPTNLYGPNDNFHPDNSHVMASLIKKFYVAKKLDLLEVVVWGSGSPKREFLHVDDLVEALIFLMDKYNDSETINVGTGNDISIESLALLIKDLVDYKGKLVFDSSYPDGTPRKILDVSKIINFGWASKIKLRDGVLNTLKWIESKDEI